VIPISLLCRHRQESRLEDSGSQVYQSSAELSNPATDTWSLTGSLSQAREEHTATLLSDGRVLAAGGKAQGCLSSAELFH